MRFCVECSNEITSLFAERFCSQACAARYNNRYRVSKGDLRPCLHCGISLRNLSGKVYCLNRCQRDYEWVERKARIESTGVEARPLIAKRYLKEKHGHCCAICNNAEWTGQPIPLVLDHINGHADDNRIENLRLVCGNCDMLLPTYKARNRGNGRNFRRERYKEGKSY